MTHAIRLGQRVYGVTQKGQIIPTLISRIELPEVSDGDSDIVRLGSELLSGRLHQDVPGIRFRALNHHLDKVWLTYDEAFEKAVTTLHRLAKEDDSVRISEQQEYQLEYERLAFGDHEAERAIIDGVTVFSESETTIELDLGDKSKDGRYSQSDFPAKYKEPGTSIWVADVKSWRLIRGQVTEVHFAPNWPRNVRYTCGGHAQLQANRVFRTKKGALNCLERTFANTLPGTLDRHRVPVVQQMSRIQMHNRDLERLRRKFA